MLKKLLVKLLSQQERVLYEQNVLLLVRNMPLFFICNIFGYIICTLIFFNAFPMEWHLAFGAGFAVVSGLIWFLCLHKVKIITRDRERGVLYMILACFSGVLWWNIYFVAALSVHQLRLMEQFVLMVSVVAFIGVALIGCFSRIYTTVLLLGAAHMAFQLLNVPDEDYHFLSVQLMLTGLVQVCFLRILNEQIITAMHIKDENSSLVDALQNKNAALEQANISQSRYLSAASHDLRQPLHALALLTNDAQRKTTEPAVQKTLQKIEEAIDSLSLSFNAMLNLSRLDAGVVKPQFTRFPIQRLFSRLLVEYSDVALQKNLSFDVHSSKVWVLSDEGMLYSILSNFVSNALRYTDKGGVLVGVRRDGDQTMKVIVYDTGSGVPSEKAKQIFNEYQRLEGAEQRAKGGVGLGLAISERMARLLGAKLLVKSTPFQGSSFGLVVPRVAAQEVVPQNNDNIMQDVLAGKRVAIIDDDEMALESLDELLSSWGMDVSVILSSDMLAEVIREDGDFDLIISDYHLGLADETGLDILNAVRKMQAELPHRLLMTGDTRTELATEARTAGVSVWYKPLRPVRFRAYLNTMLVQSGDSVSTS